MRGNHFFLPIYNYQSKDHKILKGSTEREHCPGPQAPETIQRSQGTIKKKNHQSLNSLCDSGCRLIFKKTLMGLKQASASLQACCQFNHRARNPTLSNCQIIPIAYGCESQLFHFKTNLLRMRILIWIYSIFIYFRISGTHMLRHSRRIQVIFTTSLCSQGYPPVITTMVLFVTQQKLSTKQEGS